MNLFFLIKLLLRRWQFKYGAQLFILMQSLPLNLFFLLTFPYLLHNLPLFI